MEAASAMDGEIARWARTILLEAAGKIHTSTPRISEVATENNVEAQRTEKVRK